MHNIAKWLCFNLISVSNHNIQYEMKYDQKLPQISLDDTKNHSPLTHMHLRRFPFSFDDVLNYAEY